MNDIAKNRWKKDIEKYNIPHLRLKQIAEIVKQIHPKSYVDLGCAKGTMGSLTPNINYIGCDFALDGNNIPFEFYHCDFNKERLPNSLKGHSLICCSGLFEYIEDTNSFLNNINEILNNNGYLIVSYFNMNHFSRILKLLNGNSFPVHPDWRGFFSPKDFKKKLESNGFVIERTIPVSHGFSASTSVDKTIENKFRLPRLKFYSYLFAHQLIYVCKKKKDFF